MLTKIIFKFNYLLRAADVIFGKSIEYSDEKQEILQKYKFVSDEDIAIKFGFKESLYISESGWRNNIISIALNLSELAGFFEGREIFKLSSIKALSTYNKGDLVDKIEIKLTGDYNSTANYLNINKAHLLADLSYLTNNEVLDSANKIDFERKIEVGNILLGFDNASLNASGFLKLTKSNLPSGDIAVSMVKYQDVIDVLVPENFTIPKSYLKTIIAQTTLKVGDKDLNNDDKADFKLRFSDKGVFLGDINLLELKVE